MSQVLGLSPAPARSHQPTRKWFDGWPSLVTVFAVAATLALLASLLGWRGSDLPAQMFRAELFKRDGFVLWNSQWFGGHALLAYSVLAPVFGALTGPIALGAFSGVIAAVTFERILRFELGRAAWFGATVVRARLGHEPHRRAHDLRARRRVRTRRDLRAPAPSHVLCGIARAHVFAVEPAGRRVPRDRGGRMGVRAARAPRHSDRSVRRRVAPDCHARARCSPPPATSRTSPGRWYGTCRCAPRSRSRHDACRPCGGAPRSTPPRSWRRSSSPPRWAGTSAAWASTSRGRCWRARCFPAAGSCSRPSQFRC